MGVGDRGRAVRSPCCCVGGYAQMTRHRVITTDAEVDAAIAEARAQQDDRARAVAAYYDASNDRVVIRLASGVDVAIPRRHLQGLENATDAQVANIQIEGAGSGLHWASLDVDHYVPGLLAGVFGTRRWMSELGRKGGSVRSVAKTAAARANGRMGGRPRQHARTETGKGERVMSRGLDERYRDKDGEIRRKQGNTRVSTLRQVYGEDFAPDFRSDAKLETVLEETGCESLSEYLKTRPHR